MILWPLNDLFKDIEIIKNPLKEICNFSLNAMLEAYSGNISETEIFLEFPKMRDGHNKRYGNLKSVSSLEIALLFLEIERAEIVLEFFSEICCSLPVDDLSSLV